MTPPLNANDDARKRRRLNDYSLLSDSTETLSVPEQPSTGPHDYPVDPNNNHLSRSNSPPIDAPIPLSSTPLTIVSLSSTAPQVSSTSTTGTAEESAASASASASASSGTSSSTSTVTSTPISTPNITGSSSIPPHLRLPSVRNLFDMPAVDGRADRSIPRNPVLASVSPRTVPSEPLSDISPLPASTQSVEDDLSDDDDVQILGVVELVPEFNSNNIRRSQPRITRRQSIGDTTEGNQDDDGVVVTGERQLPEYEVIHTPFGSYSTGNRSPVPPSGNRRVMRLQRMHPLRSMPGVLPNNSRFRLPTSGRTDLFHAHGRGRRGNYNTNNNNNNNNNLLRVVSTMLPFDINDSDNVSRTLHNFYNHITIPLGNSGYGAIIPGYQFNGRIDGTGGSDDIEASIMSRIERELDDAVSDKISKENLYNRKEYLQKKKLTVNPDNTRHVSDILTDVQVFCELCGVELGAGIPHDFKPNPIYNDSFEKYQLQYDVPAPWFCNKMVTEVDKELSKRVFSAKCGHVYCGRCVKNIGNRSGRIPKSAPKGATIDNPLIAAPKVCLCSKRFTAKSFTELYI